MANSPFRQKLSDILIDVSWGQIAKKYFGKSPSWFYHKLDGVDGNGGNGGNGGTGQFSEAELQQFKGALCDLADRIRRVADSL